MSSENVDIKLRLLEAARFKQEADRAAAATRGIGHGAQQAGAKAAGATGHVTRLRGGIASLSRASKLGALALGGLGLAAGALATRQLKGAVAATVDLAGGTRKLSATTGMDNGSGNLPVRA